jgi:hypothetical protein
MKCIKNFRKKLLRRWDEDGTGSGSYPVLGFHINSSGLLVLLPESWFLCPYRCCVDHILKYKNWWYCLQSGHVLMIPRPSCVQSSKPQLEQKTVAQFSDLHFNNNSNNNNKKKHWRVLSQSCSIHKTYKWQSTRLVLFQGRHHWCDRKSVLFWGGHC